MVKHGNVVGNSKREIFFFHCNLTNDNMFVWPIEMRDLDSFSKLKKMKEEILPSTSSLDLDRAKELHRFLRKMISSYMVSNNKREVFVFEHFGWSWDESKNLSFYVVSPSQVISQKEVENDLKKDEFEFIGNRDNSKIYKCSEIEPRNINQTIVDYLNKTLACFGPILYEG